jgi:hypothetical protein
MSLSLEERLQKAIEKVEEADARGSGSADKYEVEIKALKRQIIKEKKENKPPPHSACVSLFPPSPSSFLQTHPEDGIGL